MHCPALALAISTPFSTAPGASPTAICAHHAALSAWRTRCLVLVVLHRAKLVSEDLGGQGLGPLNRQAQGTGPDTLGEW